MLMFNEIFGRTCPSILIRSCPMSHYFMSGHYSMCRLLFPILKRSLLHLMMFRHPFLTDTKWDLRKFWLGWISLIAPVVKTMKLTIYLFLDFWLQIWFQKYYISSNDTQFLINKDKNWDRFLFKFPPMGQMRGSGFPGQKI
jgi:hypothetical protein